MGLKSRTTERMEELSSSLAPQERIALAAILRAFAKPKPGEIGAMVDAERGRPNCPKCGSAMLRNGKDRSGNQKWCCSACRVYSSSTADSIASSMKIGSDAFIVAIGCAIGGMTVKEAAHWCGVSQKTAFYLLSRIDEALSIAASGVRLKGRCQLDGAYFDVVLKGTRKGNMPRESRKRGSSSKGRGIGQDSVCAIFAVDEFDNMVARVVGLGQEDRAKADSMLPYIAGVGRLVTDMKACYEGMCSDNGIVHVAVKSAGKTNASGDNLAEVNELISEIRDRMYGRRTVSTRHLQARLDRICVIKMISYAYERGEAPLAIASAALSERVATTLRGIFKSLMPVDLRELYGDLALLVDPMRAHM